MTTASPQASILGLGFINISFVACVTPKCGENTKFQDTHSYVYNKTNSLWTC